MVHTTALAMVVWYLIVPSHLSQIKAANGDAATFVFNTYRTRDACEQDRWRLSADLDLGDGMRAARCSEVAPPLNRQ